MAKPDRNATWFNPADPISVDFVSGMSHRDLAAKYGKTPKGIDAHLRRNRIPRSWPIDYTTLISKLASGLTLDQIAKSLKCNRDTLRKLLTAKGFDRSIINILRATDGKGIDADNVISKYKSGMSMSNIAKSIGLSSGSYRLIKEILVDNGVKIRVDGVHQTGNFDAYEKLRSKEYMEAEYATGETSSEIGAKLGVSGTTVLRHLHNLNIERRSHLAYGARRMLGEPHQRLISYLDKNGIKHHTAYVFSTKWNRQQKTWEFDEYLEDTNTFIEVQGRYWHGLDKRARLDPKIRKKMWADLFKFKALKRDRPDSRIIYLEEGFDELQLDRIFRGVTRHASLPHVNYERVSPTVANELYEKYHYLGKCTSSYSYAAISNGTVLAVLSYGSPHRQNISQPGWLEMTRMVSIDRYPNLLSSLISHSLRDLSSSGIPGVFTFADPTPYRKGSHSGAVYKAANFKYIGMTASSYSYIDTSGDIIHKKTVYNRAVKAKQKESEYARAHSLHKIPEWPKLRFEYKMP